ncbi:MAG TPA: hypothetical protein PKE22_09060, partial [Ottowia sp.]|nr:hypothetical protein [Ottowia sp.]
MIASERVVKTHPIEAECRGSSGPRGPLDGTKKISLWLIGALQGQTAAVAGATARICNEERAR